MIRALLIDLMDTVIYDPYRESILAATGMDHLKAFRINDPHCWAEFEVAKIDEAEFVRRFFPRPDADAVGAAGGRAFDLDAFHRVRRESYRFLPGMRELLCELGGLVPRVMASNYPVWIEELRVSHGLDALFDGIYASHHLGERKPDAAFFEKLLARIERKPSECFFIDDRAQNCEAAERLGIRSHRFVDAPSLRAQLVLEGISLPTGET